MVVLGPPGIEVIEPVILKFAGVILLFTTLFIPLLHLLRRQFKFEAALPIGFVLGFGAIFAVLYRANVDVYLTEANQVASIVTREGVQRYLLAFVLLGGGLVLAYLAAGRLGKQTYRSTFHTVAGGFFLLMLLQSINAYLVALVLGAFLLAMAEYVRKSGDRSPVAEFARRVLTPAFRDGEFEGYMASFFFITGALVVTLLLPFPVALGSVAVLTFADPSASLVGRRWGRHPWHHNPQKTLEGSAAFLAVATVALTLAGFPPAVAAIVSLGVALFESLPLRIGDNLLIPLMAAMGLTSRVVGQMLAPDPGLWLVAVPLMGALGLFAHRTHMLDTMGAVVAVFFGVLVLQASPAYALSLLLFLLLGFAVTRIRYDYKKSLQAAEANEGRRTVNPVVANGMVPAFTAVLGNPLLFAGSLAAALADTFGTEIGLLHKHPVDPVTRRRVAPGSRGAVSPLGEGATLGGALLMGTVVLLLASVAWPAAGPLPARSILPAALLGGLAGAHMDTLLGSAMRFLSKEEVNLLGTLSGAGVPLLLSFLGIL
ncbi:MAG: DUF92 domain-containing protein [Euryarchaeota archaeon]|nr:DUF92 domain-containing protein [Euryarchaeota archaeon]